jgi:hypothetical protein
VKEKKAKKQKPIKQQIKIVVRLTVTLSLLKGRSLAY